MKVSILLLPLLIVVCSLSSGHALAFPARLSVPKRSARCTMSVDDSSARCGREEKPSKLQLTSRSTTSTANSYSRRSLLQSGLSAIGKAAALVAVSETFPAGAVTSDETTASYFSLEAEPDFDLGTRPDSGPYSTPIDVLLRLFPTPCFCNCKWPTKCTSTCKCI
jgi:hypothetical protein